LDITICGPYQSTCAKKKLIIGNQVQVLESGKNYFRRAHLKPFFVRAAFFKRFSHFQEQIAGQDVGQEMQEVKNNRGRESEHATEQEELPSLIQVCYMLLRS